MPIVLYWLITFLLGGEVIVGAGFIANVWRWFNDGVRNVASDVIASPYFWWFVFALVTAVTLPVATAAWVAEIALGIGVSWARIFIFVSFLYSFLIIAALALVADLFTSVLVTFSLFPWTAEKIRRGLGNSLWGMCVYELFVAMMMFWWGPYAPAMALGAFILGGLLYLVTVKRYNIPTRWFPYAAIALGLSGILWFPLASTPTSFWMTVMGRNMRPVFNMDSPIDNLLAHVAQEERRATLEAECSDEYHRIIEGLANAREGKRWGEARDLMRALDVNTTRCANPQ